MEIKPKFITDLPQTAKEKLIESVIQINLFW